MSIFNGIDWTRKENSSDCVSEFGEYAKKVGEDIGPSSVLGEEDKWYETYAYKPEGKWDKYPNLMIKHLEGRGHPIFRGNSALNRRFRKRKSGRSTIHFTAASSNIELLFRTIFTPANQFSIYGAVSSWCEHLTQDSWPNIIECGRISFESER